MKLKQNEKNKLKIEDSSNILDFDKINKNNKSE